MRPKYKELYEKAQETINFMRSTEFNISYRCKGDRDCEHSFDDWKLESDGGFAYYVFTCSKCGMEVDQSIGERVKPENVPSNPSITHWRE